MSMPPRSRLLDATPILTLVGAVALGVALLAPYAWLVLLTDGMLPVALVAGAAGWGAWPTAWLGFGRHSAGRQACIATALGLGWIGALTLAAGAAGLLNQATAWTLLAIGGVCGLWRLYRVQAREQTLAASCQWRTAVVMLLPLAVPLVVVLFGATLPPGVLWPQEAFGYDVLEYHLQAPREYFDAERIEFLPHNVYASFPQQMEMLYLLLMHMAGDAYEAAIPAQLLHALCGILAVVALGCWTEPGRRRLVVLLVAGATPWVAYLGCLAYVENGLLFFAAVAAGLILDDVRSASGHSRSGSPASARVPLLCEQCAGATGKALLTEQWHPAIALTAGICAGLAGGCKYTALVFVCVGLGLAWMVAMRGSPAVRLRRLSVFGLGALLAFSPWMIRNAAFTENPVYPFAYEWFGGAAWSAEQNAQWKTGHSAPAEYDSPTGRLSLAARELFGDYDAGAGRFRPTLFGQVLFVLALAGLALRRSRAVALLAVWSLLILLAWMWATFVPGRFAVVLIAPLALLAGMAADAKPRRRDWVILLIALAGAGANDWTLAGRLREHIAWFEHDRGAPLSAAVGQTDAFVANHWLNSRLPPNASVWLVGEARVFYVAPRAWGAPARRSFASHMHYTVAFSRNPWIEFARGGGTATECVDWLRERGVTHVVFVWSEIDRLRESYGFADIVTRRWVSDLERAGLERMELGTADFAAIYQIRQD